MTDETAREGVLAGLPHVDAAVAPGGWSYRLALFMGLLFITAILQVPFHVTTIVGGSGRLAIVVGGAAVLGGVMATRVRLRTGLGVTLTMFGAGLGGYLLAIPDLYATVVSLELLADFVDLLLGEMSLLQIFRADLWVVSIAPAPVCGTVYLLLRRHYSLSVWVGGVALLFFILTGDASDALSLVGATSALGVLGFGSLDQSDGTWRQMREIGMVLAGVIVLARLSKPLLDRYQPRPQRPAGGESAGGSESVTMERNLIGGGERVDIQGRISLTPERRFTVSADEVSYWHVGSYDRFTGRAWVRSGGVVAYTDPLPPPPGTTQTVDQQIRFVRPMQAMPAAWQPVAVDDGVAARTLVTEHRGIQPARAFDAGERYSVTSERAVWTPADLRAADGDAPESIRRRYLQRPADTPGRVERLAADLTRDAPTRFDRVVRIQRWLQATKDYSLEVSRPDGNIVDAFLFEMDRGYCVYFATAMVVLLRSLDIPARFAVGYTTGSAIDRDEWEIRGLNSHAWVQVYFPDVGWVTVDPTPRDARRDARERLLDPLDVALEEQLDPGLVRPDNGTPSSVTDRSAVDADRLTPTTNETTPTPTADRPSAESPTPARSTSVGRRDLFTGLSGSDQLALLAGGIGIVLGVTRLEYLLRGAEFLAVRRQDPTDSPKRDIERAFDRLEWVLTRQYRERRPNETRRSYIESVGRAGVGGERLQQILQRYERAWYQDEVSRRHADVIIHLVNAFVRDHHPLSAAIRWLTRNG